MDDMTLSQRRKTMQHIRSRDTKSEVILRKMLYHEGFRYRKNWTKLPGKPDIVLTKYHICIFVDGEYFHGKDWNLGERERVEHGNNASYWIRKIEQNIQRDRRVDSELSGMGWAVLRFWSRDVQTHPEECVKVVKDTIFEKKIDE